MGKRRGSGEGSIYELKSRARWCAAITVYTPVGRTRKWLYGQTRREVQEKLTIALRARQQGLPPTDDRRTVAQFMTDWLVATKASVRPRTWERYEQYVRCHAIPVVGHIVLTHLQPQQLQYLDANRIEAGLSASSVAHLHTVLHTALAQAEAWASCRATSLA